MALSSRWVLLLALMAETLPVGTDSTASSAEMGPLPATGRHHRRQEDAAIDWEQPAEDVPPSNITTILAFSHAPACRRLAGSLWGVLGATELGYREGSSRRMEQILAAMQHFRLQVDYQYAIPEPQPPFHSNAPFLAMQLFPSWFKTPPIFLAGNTTQVRIAISDDTHCERNIIERDLWHHNFEWTQMICDGERDLVRAADLLVLATAKDRTSLAKQYHVSPTRMLVLPMVPEMACNRRGYHHRTGLMFMGGQHPLNRLGMLWFATQVYPIVLARIPDVTLTVLGRIPNFTLPNHTSVRVLGLVSDDDMHHVFATARVFIAPTLNCTGVSTKVLAAIEHCVPVVSKGAVERGFFTGITGKPVVTAESAQEFATAVIRLYEDEDEWRNARQQQVHWSRRSAKLYGKRLDRFCAASLRIAERRALPIR
eukprot:EG_transcript_7486